MNSTGFDADAARYNRQNRTSEPTFAPGMGEDVYGGSQMDNNGDSMGFGFGAGGGSDPTAGFGTGGLGFGDANTGGFNAGTGGFNAGAGGFNAGAGGGSFGGFSTGFAGQQQMQQPQQPVKSDEDKIIDAAVAVGKAGKTFGVDVIKSFGQLTPAYWEYYGKIASAVSAVGFAVGVVAGIFGMSGSNLMVGSCLSGAVGILVLMFTTEKARGYSSKYKDDNTEVPVEEPEPAGVFPSMEDSGAFDDFGADDFSDNDADSDDFGDDFGDDDWDFSDAPDDFEVSGSEGVSPDEALATMPEVDKGMYTRSYLYEMFTKVLPTMKPNFASLSEVEEDSDTFNLWDEKLIEAAEALNCKEENLPELMSVEENAFIIVVTCSRPVGIKAEALGDELATIYAYQGSRRKAGVYATTETVGKRVIITIFTGDSVMVSLKDMMLSVEDSILDTKYFMPVIVGINHIGDVIWFDFRKLESILITGMPRKGKSWFAQAVLTQMCALVPPSELWIYICDPKDGISDYKDFSLPHVKKFVTTDEGILDEVRRLVKEEAPKRKKLIGDSHNVNIWDFKAKYPDVKIPVIYILIDEVVTLAMRMEKEIKKEFQGYITELISQLPALGIRGIFVPHVVKDEILPKTATDLIPCRVSVCGDAAHIEACTATKPRDFKFKLTNNGDMAVRMPDISPETLFIKAPVLTASNEANRELFDYLRRAWDKLEPEETENSVAKEAAITAETEKLLKSLEDDNGANEAMEGFLSGLDDSDFN